MRTTKGNAVIHKFALPATFCLSLFAAGAVAADLNGMMARGGEWALTLSNGITPATTQKICYRGGHSIAELAASRLHNCSRKTISAAGGIAHIDAKCAIDGNINVTIRGTVTAIGDTKFHGEGQMHMDGVPSGGLLDQLAQLPLTVSGDRLGPCQPGDPQL